MFVKIDGGGTDVFGKSVATVLNEVRQIRNSFEIIVEFEE